MAVTKLSPVPDETPRPSVTAVPRETRARGFALYVGIDEAAAAANGIDLTQIVTALRNLTAELAPGAETYAAVALAPSGSGGRDVDVVRLALQEPSAVARHRTDEDPGSMEGTGVIVDISRKRVVIDDEVAPLTFKEFELIQYLVTHKGQTISRAEIIRSLWRTDDVDIPNDRTIDVHVRRLRSKLSRFEDIVRTVRGEGYRFDEHPDVTILFASAPSPDVF
jgi:DNA-binding winged helix-turn-helix (wHTH) protein